MGEGLRPLPILARNGVFLSVQGELIAGNLRAYVFDCPRRSGTGSKRGRIGMPWVRVNPWAARRTKCGAGGRMERSSQYLIVYSGRLSEPRATYCEAQGGELGEAQKEVL
jgi:hypothetical protein